MDAEGKYRGVHSIISCHENLLIESLALELLACLSVAEALVY